MADCYFYALTLTGDKASDVWDPENENDNDGGHQLVVKQALMGTGAKEGEQNVIQVEAMSWKESIKVPVAILEAGGPNCQVPLDLSFPDPPVTFTLIKGKGPVHILGNHFLNTNEYGPLSDDEEMNDEEDIEEEFQENGIQKKRKLSVISEEDEEEHKSKRPKNGKDKGSSAKTSKEK